MIRRALSLVGGNVAVALTALVTAAVLARTLGPETMGHYQAIVRWTAVLAGIGSLSWGQATIYVMTRHHDWTRQLVTNALLASMIQASFVGLVGYLLSPVIFGNESMILNVARLFLLFIPLNLIADYLGHVLRLRLEIGMFNAVRVAQSVLFLAAVAGLFAMGHRSLPVVLGALLVSHASSSAFLMTYVGVHSWLGKPTWAGAIPTLQYAARIHPGLQARTLNLYLDQLMIAVMLPARDLGLYASAVSAASVIRIGSSAFLYLAQPEIQAAPTDDRARIIGRLVRMNLLITVPPSLLLIAAMPTLIPLVYGTAFAEAILPARLLCIAAIIESTVVTIGGCLIGIGRGAAVTVVQIMSLGVSAIGLLILLSDTGITGASAISIISYAVGALLLFWYIRRSLRIGIRDLLFSRSVVA